MKRWLIATIGTWCIAASAQAADTVICRETVSLSRNQLLSAPNLNYKDVRNLYFESTSSSSQCKYYAQQALESLKGACLSHFTKGYGLIANSQSRFDWVVNGVATPLRTVTAFCQDISEVAAYQCKWFDKTTNQWVESTDPECVPDENPGPSDGGSGGGEVGGP